VPASAPPLEETAAVAPVGPAGSPISSGETGDPGAGWQRILEKLPPKTRAYFRAARAQVDGDRLLLFFPYGFHHKMALESAGQVEPLVKDWLGQATTLDLRLQESAPNLVTSAPAARPVAPEEDPLIKAAERKLEGRVVRVRPLKELE
jgi:hypothetical protein